jgi:two-component system phosphate regulon sensor histidine kinase PhoR
MKERRLLWQLFPTYLLIALAILLSVGAYVLVTLKDFYYRQMAADLEVRARLVESLVETPFLTGDPVVLEGLVNRLGEVSASRITLVDPAGSVLGDSHEDPARMDNHAERPEVREALMGRTGQALRFSQTLGENRMYLAVPVEAKGAILGVVRVSLSMEFIDKKLLSIKGRLALGGGALALLVAIVSWWVSRRISRPLEEMKLGAARFAKGDLDQPVTVAGALEVSALAESLNQMASQLDERIGTITAQRNEREAILYSMVEGVLAVDAGERVLSMNQAAAELFGMEPQASLGKSVLEVVRNPDLQRFVKKTLSCKGVLESDILMKGADQERYLQTRGTQLRGAGGEAVGAVLVMNDVTRMRQLESVRRDFAANVSHELKTPITSIKGFVETLEAGAIDQPEDARRFLAIVSKQVDRLHAIIEDLLCLSKVEQGAGRGEVPFREVALRDVLEAAIQACSAKAGEKNVQVVLSCAGNLMARVSPPLLEQAVVNLVDNAIKYGGPESRVDVEATADLFEILIRVRDAGRGIEPVHWPRLFERFYRIDEARSRELGGTGLGLAIVKHIAQAHGGSVEVTSEIGKGSVFTLHLPAA